MNRKLRKTLTVLFVLACIAASASVRIGMRDGLAESRTRAVLPLPDGRVAIATTATVDIFDGTRFTMSVELPPAKSINIEGYEGGRRLYIDKSNRLWLKNDRHQLYILDIDSGVPLSPDSVMKSIGFPENVSNVYLAGDTIAVITPENKLCIGTHRHCGTAITVTDIPDDIVTHSGKLLLGFRSGRICTIKPDGTIASAVPPSAQPAKSPLIINVSGNSLYIGSSHTDSSAITAYSLPLFEQEYSFGTSGTISGISAVNDTLLVASNRGLSAYSQGGSKTKTLLNEPLTAIALDNQCGIWTTTSGNGAIFTDKRRESLFKIDTTAYRNRTSPTFCSKLAQQLADTIAPGITNCSLYGSDGTIWLGTRKGLIATDSTGRIIAVIDRTSGLSTDNVQSVCLDKNGSIWITTANGISRIVTTAPGTFSVTSFGQLDGILLDGREFRQARMYADTSGIIHAAFSGGVCSFSPDSLLNTSRYTYTVTPPGPTEPKKQTSPWWAITGFAAMLLSIMFVVLKKRIRSKKRKEYSRREFLLSAGANAAGKIIEKKRLEDPDAEFLYKLQNAVEENLTEKKLNVQILSRIMAMDRTVLYRRMMALTGLTPSVYIKTARMNAARQLLTETNLGIADIATKAGFASPKYFSKVFRQHFGKSPADFRNEAANNHLNT